MSDETFLENIQSIADAIGDTNEIEVDTYLFLRLLEINCSKKMFTH